MPLTVKQFDSRSSRDLEYYKLSLTHHDVMRYSDQEEGALVQDAEGKVKRQGGHMVFCVAYGPARRSAPVEADSGISRVTGNEPIAEASPNV